MLSAQSGVPGADGFRREVDEGHLAQRLEVVVQQGLVADPGARLNISLTYPSLRVSGERNVPRDDLFSALSRRCPFAVSGSAVAVQLVQRRLTRQPASAECLFMA